MNYEMVIVKLDFVCLLFFLKIIYWYVFLLILFLVIRRNIKIKILNCWFFSILIR